MSNKHKNRGVTARVNGEDCTDSFSMAKIIGAVEVPLAPDPFHAEEKYFQPVTGAPSIVRVNEYLNEYRRTHPEAALLQIIPTAPDTYLFVWES